MFGLGGQAIDRFYVQPVADPKAVHADIMAALESENGCVFLMENSYSERFFAIEQSE